MVQEENQQPSLVSLPVLPRLDRLDRLLQLLEEKQRESGRHLCSPAVIEMEQDDSRCRAMSSALEEVHQKGTLMDRLSMLENRVLKLSLEMDERNSWRSMSSSTTTTGIILEISDKKLDMPQASKQNEGEKVQIQNQPSEMDVAACEFINLENEEIDRRQKRTASRKWRGCFGMGC